MLFTSMLRKKQFNSFAYNGLQNFIIEDLEGLT